jgi:glycosyltransferase involved in cell wall biosynthesis
MLKVDDYSHLFRFDLGSARAKALCQKPMTSGEVLFLTPQWKRDGGVGTHVQASAAVLAQHGFQVNVLAAKIDADEPVAGVTLFHRPELLNVHAPVRVRVGEAMSSSPSVVHLHQVDDPEIVELMHSDAPVVISAHGYTACTAGLYYFQPGEECTRAHGLGCLPHLTPRGCAHARISKSLPAKFRTATRGLAALKRADLAISYSTAVDRHLATNGVTARKIVPYFPTMDAKPGSGHQARRRVVFAGRIVPPKGVDILIRAARSVDGEFVICGDGRRLEAMRELARELGVEQRVCFKGWLDPDALADEFAHASIVVVPSVWPEPFGIVGIEAFAAGRPAVASATGGIVDWMEDGVTGLCFAPGDELGLVRALNELLAEPERQRTMGLAGSRMVAERFSPRAHLAALLAGYETARSTWQAAGRS